MKHNLKIILILIGFFLLSQVIGLLIVNQYIDHKVLAKTGKVTFTETPVFERPPVEESTSVWYIISAILIGTAILLVIIRLRKIRIWKTWYFISVFITLGFAFYAFFKQIPVQELALSFSFVLAAVMGYYKIFSPKIWLHNISELFIYGGLAAIFVPIMNLFSAIMLLLLISAYDMYAVWKSKHMVTLAKFTTESRVFAGLSIPYRKSTGKIQKKATKKIKSKKSKIKNAILGGGDIGFPLLFAGVAMKNLMLSNTVLTGFLKVLIIPLTTTTALYFLFVKGEKNKFYPAMPFLSLGCFAGYFILLLIELL
ncbi:hypothetical protein GF323_01145 [Candidatus Woesearchaeota archaeon]|nr:hypothetical protein [Candidatus Woesearchaeota archaeon]